MALTAPSLLFAQGATGPGGSGRFTNPIEFNTLSEFLGKLLKVIVEIAFPIIVLMIIVSGFLFVSAQGKPDKLETARKAILWTLIGAALILGAFVLSEAICGTVKEIGGTC